MNTVLRTADFRRIENLPRRIVPKDLSCLELHALEMSNRLSTPDGDMELRPIQSLALMEIETNGGLLGAVGVGHGKTLISLLAPSMVGAERPLLLLPAQLKKLTIESILPDLKKHWKISPNLRIESYHELSNNPQLLNEYEPDLIIADECHRISRKGSARTRRILRYFDSHPLTKFVGLSGTITRKSLEDYWHLLLMALKEKAPVPLKWRELKVWALALDDGIPYPERAHLGALLRFCENPLFESLCLEQERVRVREGYQKRLTETPGVLATSDAGVDASLVIKRHCHVYEAVGARPWIKEALNTLKNEWVTPGGEEITDAVDYWRKAREIAMGFYYEWDWEEPDLEWLSARRNWRRYVRGVTQRNPQYDTEMLVTLACENGHLVSWEYNEWICIKVRANPQTRTVWCSDTVLNDALELAGDRNTIIWFEQRAVGARLKELAPERPLFSGGADANTLLKRHVDIGQGPCFASIKAHGVGVNLQSFNDSIVLTPPSSGATWEQLIGRTHRAGQQADEVTVTVYQHTEAFQSAFDRAVESSKYIEQSTGQRQKLNYATVAWCDGNMLRN